MRELSRRTKWLEQHTGKDEGKVYFIDALNLSEKEIEAEVAKIRQHDPKAIFFIDDISLEENN